MQGGWCDGVFITRDTGRWPGTVQVSVPRSIAASDYIARRPVVSDEIVARWNVSDLVGFLVKSKFDLFWAMEFKVNWRYGREFDNMFQLKVHKVGLERVRDWHGSEKCRSLKSASEAFSSVVRSFIVFFVFCVSRHKTTSCAHLGVCVCTVWKSDPDLGRCTFWLLTAGDVITAVNDPPELTTKRRKPTFSSAFNISFLQGALIILLSGSLGC